MRYKTHLAFGLFCGLMFLPEGTFQRLIFLGIVLIGSLLPDVDTPESKFGSKAVPLSHIFRFIAGHRGIFHSVFAVALFGGLIWIFAGQTYGIAMLVGYASHLLIDGFTKNGINYLHPISNFRISGFITTGDFSEHLLLIGIILADIWKIKLLFF